MATKTPEVREPAKAKKLETKAKMNFVINHNGYYLEIKVGDDLSKVPSMYLQNLKTEGVL